MSYLRAQESYSSLENNTTATSRQKDGILIIPKLGTVRILWEVLQDPGLCKDIVTCVYIYIQIFIYYVYICVLYMHIQNTWCTDAGPF